MKPTHEPCCVRRVRRAQEDAPDGEEQDGVNRFGPRAEVWLQPFVQPYIDAKDDMKQRKLILTNILEAAKERQHVKMCALRVPLLIGSSSSDCASRLQAAVRAPEESSSYSDANGRQLPPA